MKKTEKSPMTRSENMSRIRSRDTKPEIYLRKLLWHRGYRYVCNYKGLPGHPDIFIRKYSTAVFVNGCFWHMHKGCRYSNIPKSNTEYWTKKLKRNAERDLDNYRKIGEQGIKIIIVWECTIKQMSRDPELENKICSSIAEILNSKENSIIQEF